MPFDSIKAARAAGFEGFVPADELRERLDQVPDVPGVYLILTDRRKHARVLTRSYAGLWKGKNPTLPVAELRTAWVTTSAVLYIGKAGTSLRTRLRAYLRHGAGHAAAHWGGRAIWQLADSGRLLVAWRLQREPRAIERALIAEFAKQHGKRPFANRTG